MKSFIEKSVIAVILSVILPGLCGPSFAGEYYAKVNFADLDLDQPGDVAVLYDRIQDAARTVCTDDTATWGYHRKAFDRCFGRTVDKAVTGIGNSTLTALHAGQNIPVAKR